MYGFQIFFTSKHNNDILFCRDSNFITFYYQICIPFRPLSDYIFVNTSKYSQFFFGNLNMKQIYHKHTNHYY